MRANRDKSVTVSSGLKLIMSSFSIFVALTTKLRKVDPKVVIK